MKLTIKPARRWKEHTSKRDLACANSIVNSYVWAAHRSWDKYVRYREFVNADDLRVLLHSYRACLDEIGAMLKILNSLGYKTNPECCSSVEYLNEEIPFDHVTIEAP